MNNKLQVDDFVLITGPSHYEKAKVINIDKKTGVVTLDNQMKITQNFENLSKTQMKAEPFDQDKYDYLHANSRLETNMNIILRGKSRLPKEILISINSRIEKWIQKYELKKI